MKTSEFIKTLRAAPSKKVIFQNGNGDAVHPGYHLTEIKAASFNTVDCGAQTNCWQESIFQLWVPEDAEDEYMTAEKFVGIFDRVSSLIDIADTAEARIEYGDENFFPSVYAIDSISEKPETLRILLAPPAMTCKARDRELDKQPSEACSFHWNFLVRRHKG